jgi:hypothetical protein
LLGQSLAGYYDHNDDQRTHQQPPIRYTQYLTNGHFWASVFENWESEFFQIGFPEELEKFLALVPLSSRLPKRS